MAADFLKRSEEPAPDAAGRRLGFFERRRRRARLRERLAAREQMLLELGALVFELHRQGRRAPELLQARAAELDAVDAEIRAMQRSLEGGDAWPSEFADVHSGEWGQGGPFATGEWDGAEWAETGEWDAEQAGDWEEQGEWQETGEYEAPADADLGETQEWTAPDALEAPDVSADPHDAAAEDALIPDPPSEDTLGTDREEPS